MNNQQINITSVLSVSVFKRRIFEIFHWELKQGYLVLEGFSRAPGQRMPNICENDNILVKLRVIKYFQTVDFEIHLTR